MLDTKGTEEYWREQTNKGGNPCHYHNKWQDKYAFAIRTSIFKKSDFRGAKKVVDIGCGVGEYTHEISKLTDAKITGFDFPFNIDRARSQYKNSNVQFEYGSLPDERIRRELLDADISYTTTVCVHLSDEARDGLLSYFAGMRAGARVMLLEYIPFKVPEFQKGLPYKNVETVHEIDKRFKNVGFNLTEVRHVNFIDSFLFHHLGTNVVTYLMTLLLDRMLRLLRFRRSKYKLLIFEKVNNNEHTISTSDNKRRRY